MTKRSSRENPKDRKCSEDMGDKPPPKKRKRDDDAKTMWIKDDTLPTDSSADETPKPTILLLTGSPNEEDEDEDEDYEPDDEPEDEPDFLQYLMEKYVVESDRPQTRSQTQKKKELTKKEKEEKVPLTLTKKESAYYKSQSVDKRQELFDIMKRMSTLSMTEGEVPHKFKVLELPVSDYVKSTVIKKISAVEEMGAESGEAYKLRTWIDAFLRVPFGKIVPLPVKIEDGRQKCTEFMLEARKSMDQSIYGMVPAKTQIMQILAQLLVNPNSVGNVIALQGPMGVGKCHAKDTPILMYDGSFKLVQDVCVDDLIMGDNSKPRKVLGLGRGKDEMYRITPVKGEPFTVNSEHILCLKQSGVGSIVTVHNLNKTIGFKTKRVDNKTKALQYKTFSSYESANEYLHGFGEEDNITEISVKDYLKLSSEVKRNYLKLYRKGVDFDHKELDFDPYIIGLWLGDGASNSPTITSQDAVILGYLNTHLHKYDLMLVYRAQYDYYIRSYKKNQNKFLDVLKTHNLLNNKHVPSMYKINDRETRLKVLAGLLDSDGYMIHNCFEIAQKSKVLADDILFLARSLGFAAYCKTREKSCDYKSEKRTGTYHIIIISGNIDEIPVRIQRKKASVRQQDKDVLVTGFTVESIGEGDYYGFTLDGNSRYLMGDFTVTHNTSLARNAIANVMKRPFEFFSLGGASDIANFVGHSYTYEGSMWGRIADSIMHAGAMNPVLYFDELDKVSSTPHGDEIVSMMIHLTDRSQNSQFHDRYFSGVDFDLSQCLFVFSFNDIEKVHPILRDRMSVIHCGGYNETDKKAILKDYIWPQLLERLKFNIEDIVLTDEAIKHLISEFSGEEKGVRTLIRTVETMMTRLNMLRIVDDESMKQYVFFVEYTTPFVITEPVLQKLLTDLNKKDPEHWRSMYN